MKKLIALVLSLALVLSCASSALALNFTGRLGNESTFETLQEASKSSVDVVANIVENNAVSPLSPAAEWVEHPVLANYPEGTTYVYRSANQYAGRAAARLNTNLFVYVDQKFESKDAAYAFLKDAGLIDIIEEAVGSILLVSPIGTEFGTADATAYYALQTAALSQKERGTDAEGKPVKYSSAEYFGGYGYTYFIGIDGGATFFNNYIAPEIDFVGRIAGALLIGGSMQHIRKPATFVPVYFVNGQDKAIEKYKAINGVDAKYIDDSVTVSYNQAWPLRKVVEAKMDKVDVAAAIKDAYYGLFVKAMRLPVLPQGMYSAGSPYYGYGFDQAPYSLCDRNAVINGVTEDGIYLTRHDGDNFIEYQNAEGEYLQTWFEYLPAEVQNHTAPAGSVPLILANHGGSDDPRVFVDEIGLLDLIGKERIAVVAPEHQYISGEYQEVEIEALPAIVKYMLDTYPELDRSRVYVTGYSMGGRASLATLSGDASLFAAAVPQGSVTYLATEEQAAQYKDIDIPIMFMTSTYDFHMDEPTQTLRLAYWFGVKSIYFDYTTLLNLYLGYNEMDTVDFDFETYPMSGFKADSYKRQVLNGEYASHTWMMNNAEGVPMVGLNVTEYLPHGLYQEYGKLAWDFLKHYTRDPETKVISYNPYVK